MSAAPAAANRILVVDDELSVRESVEGRGSTFWVRLRAAQPATTPVA